MARSTGLLADGKAETTATEGNSAFYAVEYFNTDPLDDKSDVDYSKFIYCGRQG